MHNAIKDPPGLGDQLLQICSKLLFFRLVVLLVMLLTLECSTDIAENIEDIMNKVVPDFIHDLDGLVVDSIGYRCKRAFGTNHYVHKIPTADVFDCLA